MICKKCIWFYTCMDDLNCNPIKKRWYRGYYKHEKTTKRT